MDNHQIAIKKDTFSRISNILIIISIILFSGIIRLPSLTQPLGPDQGIMSVIGLGILDGKLPYRDFWEMGSPAIFFTYALIFKLFGNSMAVVPIADTLISMLTTFLILILCRAIWNKQIGYISSFFFAFFSSGVRLGMHSGGDIAFGTFWYICQRETFILPLVVSGLYFTISSEKYGTRIWKLILSGFLTGLAFVYKFPSLVFFVCLMGYVSLSTFLDKDQAMVKLLIFKNISLLTGFIFSLVPFILFFFLKGALTDMFDIIFGYVFSVYSQLNHDTLTIISTGLRRTYFLTQENYILWIFFIASTFFIILNDRTKENILIVVWAMASLVYIISHREFFGYHYLVTLPPFSILTGYGIFKALGPTFDFRRIFTVEMGKAVIILTVLANFFTFTTLVHAHYTKFLFYTTGKITKDQYYEYFNAYPKHDFSFPADYKVSKYIENNTKSDDLIYVLGGTESVIYYLTGRQSPSRFVFSWILFYFSHGKTNEAEVYREELLLDLKSKIPKYIVTVRSLETFKEFSHIYNHINKNYVLEKEFPDDRFLYRYNNPK